MVDEFDTAVGYLCYAAPRLDDPIHRTVVVLRRFVTRHERVDDKVIDAARGNLFNEPVRYRFNDHGTGPTGCRDYEPLIAPAVNE